MEPHFEIKVQKSHQMRNRYKTLCRNNPYMKPLFVIKVQISHERVILAKHNAKTSLVEPHVVIKVQIIYPSFDRSRIARRNCLIFLNLHQMNVAIYKCTGGIRGKVVALWTTGQQVERSILRQGQDS